MPKPTFFNLPDDKKRLITDIAIDEFVEQGYEGASISKMVAKAGIAKGSFYQYFEDKADLFNHLLTLGAEEKGAFFATTPSANLSPFDYVRWLMHGNVHFEVSNPKLARIALNAMQGDAPGGREFARQMQAASAQFFRDLLQRGMDAGYLDPDLNLEMATFIFSLTSIHISEYIRDRIEIVPEDLVSGKHNAEIEKVYDALLHILEHGMGKR